MKQRATALVDRRLRAPAENRAVLVDPPLETAGELIAANRRLLAGQTCDISGRSLPELAAQSRVELLGEAHRYTSAYCDVEPASADGPILMAGHQPTIFHPGVWLKNFALSALAQRHGAAAVNLLIDSDTIKSAGLRVPGGSVETPTARVIPMDHETPEIPYEDRAVVDEASFTSFGQRVRDVVAPLTAHPFIEQYWPMVVDRRRDTDNLGDCLAQARRQWEGRWGGAALEIPQSRVCQLEAVHWLTAHMLRRLPELHGAYNGVLVEYRRQHGVRSVHHPVADLAADGEWLEAPFWIWDAASPRRRGVFARRRGDELLITDRDRIEIALPLASDGELTGAVEVLADLPRQGIKLRTRALGTTLLARLLLGDLFLHGIGGAKYDQLTDELLARFFGVEPPRFMVISGTLQLPIERPAAPPDAARRTEQTLRSMDYHPETFLDADDPAHQTPEVDTLAATKRRWVETAKTPANAKQRHDEIVRANAALGEVLAPKRTRLEREVARRAAQARADAVLASREFGFCLHPESNLRDFLLVFSPAML